MTLSSVKEQRLNINLRYYEKAMTLKKIFEYIWHYLCLQQLIDFELVE